jgi:hypothetical protein
MNLSLVLFLSGLGIVSHTRLPFLRASALNRARSRGLQRLTLLATFLRSPCEVFLFLIRFLPKSLSFLMIMRICRIEIILRYFGIKVKSYFRLWLDYSVVAKLILDLDNLGIFVYS